jgi:hypothetical protein
MKRDDLDSLSALVAAHPQLSNAMLYFAEDFLGGQAPVALGADAGGNTRVLLICGTRGEGALAALKDVIFLARAVPELIAVIKATQVMVEQISDRVQTLQQAAGDLLQEAISELAGEEARRL